MYMGATFTVFGTRDIGITVSLQFFFYIVVWWMFVNCYLYKKQFSSANMKLKKKSTKINQVVSMIQGW